MHDYDRPRRPRDRADEPDARSGGPLYSGLFLALGMLLGALGLWGVSALKDRARPALDPDAAPRAAALDAEETEAVSLFERAKPSVVNVDVVLLRPGRWDDMPTETATSGGSGFVWDDAGRIVTNFHVIAESLKRPNTELRVVLADRSSWPAKLVGAAPDFDLAVVQIAAPKDKLRPIAVGTAADLKVGQKVYAIGNPFGLSLTMTKGLVSSLNRIIEAPTGTKIPRVIQTDAAINPGNSGGPLLDKIGRLVGVNTSIATPNGGNVGIGFAIPVETVNRVVPELIRDGKYLRPDLGLKLYDERRLRQARYDRGVMIERVVPGRAAAKAGLRGVRYTARGLPAEIGDIVVAINGERVDDVEDYERVLRELRPGAEVTVRYLRGGAEAETTVTVDGV